MNERRSVVALIDGELGQASSTSSGKPQSSSNALGWNPRRLWTAAVALALCWSLWSAEAGPGSFNTRGWPQVLDFVSAAATPQLSSEFLSIVAEAITVTVAYAVTGTALSVGIGVIAGVLTSQTWWRCDPQSQSTRNIGALWWVARAAISIPRGIHEAALALVLLQILGADPMVAVLAIGIAFGAITAKVVAEFIDDAAQAPYDNLRTAGASRLSAMTYALLPAVGADVVSYGFYRLECAMRSAVVLGMIGAGGLGFQLALSFQTLRYSEIWTLIYTLVALSAVVDWWSAAVRNRPSGRRRRWSILAFSTATVFSVWYLGLAPQSVVSDRSRSLALDWVRAAWPPRLPTGGWSALWTATLDTLVISIVAIAAASALAWSLSFLAARTSAERPSAMILGAVIRFAFLLLRSIPPPVWALMVVFIVYPGPLAGGLALGLYTFGVLGRLDAEVVENAELAPTRSLRMLGASRSSAFAYGTVPIVAPRLVALSLYRWEVAMRETVIVGLVGAGGLGRILSSQNAAFDRGAMVTTIITLIGLALAADLLSARMRGDLR